MFALCALTCAICPYSHEPPASGHHMHTFTHICVSDTLTFALHHVSYSELKHILLLFSHTALSADNRSPVFISLLHHVSPGGSPILSSFSCLPSLVSLSSPFPFFSSLSHLHLRFSSLPLCSLSLFSFSTSGHYSGKGAILLHRASV